MEREPKQLATDLESVSASLSKHQVNLSSSSLKRLWEIVTGKRKLSREAMDRLALFAGFQDWQDFSDALHGNVDASVNYEDESSRRK